MLSPDLRGYGDSDESEKVEDYTIFHIASDVVALIDHLGQDKDFTGVLAVVDLAVMRDAMNNLGGDSNKINPLMEQNPGNTNFAYDAKYASLKAREQKILAVLKDAYNPVYPNWTTKRCAVCKWIEDWGYNKMIICNRCQIAVHQECYGARDINDFTSRVCRACEVPLQKQECYLCPIKDIFRCVGK